MRGRARRALALTLLLALGAFAGARTARASIEQFATFDVFAPEVDDENALDYFLARPLDAWRDEWEAAPSAMRSDQGCMTSAIWYQSNEIKARSTMGARTWLDVGFLEHTDPGGTYRWLQFDIMRATRHRGAFGLRFRPAYDKSSQDFAALWTAGDAHSPLQARVTMTLEDTFNSLWTFRQAAVGDGHLEPYRVHPFEPAVQLLSRGRHHRVEISDTWLTYSRRDVIDPDSSVAGTRTLWGNHALVLAERYDGAWTTIARFEETAVQTSQSTLAARGDGHVDRHRWSAELALRRQLTPNLRAEGRYLYMSRSEDWRPPVAVGSFDALDRMAHAELAWRARNNWWLRTGLLYDRIGITQHGAPPGFTWGSRKESRAFVGLEARFGRVAMQATEGIELDSEPYTVTFHHDKAFLHIQTTF